MPVQPDPEQATTDSTVLSVRLQELREAYPATVRNIAGRWADGLKALLGLTGTIGLLAAPFASDRLAATTQVVVGGLLVCVFLAGVAGLWLTMTAAYGTGRLDPEPQSLSELEVLRRKHGDRDRSRLIWGRRFAAAALLVLAAAVGVAWINPWHSTTSMLKLTTNSNLVYCGQVIQARDGRVAVLASVQGRAQIPLAEIARVTIVGSCGG
jgi:hypothetical protein